MGVTGSHHPTHSDTLGSELAIPSHTGLSFHATLRGMLKSSPSRQGSAEARNKVRKGMQTGRGVLSLGGPGPGLLEEGCRGLVQPRPRGRQAGRQALRQRVGADGDAQTSLSDDPTKGPGRHVLSLVSELQSWPCAPGRAHVSPQHSPWLWTPLYLQKWPRQALSQANPLFRSLLITRQPNSEGPARAGAAGTEATVTSSACLETSGYGRGRGGWSKSVAPKFVKRARSGILLSLTAQAPTQKPREQKQQAPAATSPKLAWLGCTLPAGLGSPST